MIKKLLCALALAVALFKPSHAEASGSCLFYATMTVSDPYVVETTGTPNGTLITPINGQNGTWLDVGLISSGTDCNHLTGASFTILIPNNWIGNNPSPLTAGTIQIQCWKHTPQGDTVVSSAPVNLVIDPYCTQCTFQFYVAACDGQGACTVGVCKTCLGSQGQQ